MVDVYSILQVEQAGGYSSCDGKLVSGLDVEIKEHDQRTQVVPYYTKCRVSLLLGFKQLGIYFIKSILHMLVNCQGAKRQLLLHQMYL